MTVSIEEYVVELRREFHRYPELSLAEERTVRRICEELDGMGIAFEQVGGNVIGKLDFGEGKRLAIRADIDALPIQEEVDVPWQSEVPGVMHACGHDAHTAILLATARMLLDMRKTLSGTIYLCFQKAEEKGRGAGECVEYLQAQGGVDYAISAHLMSMFEPGQMDIKPGIRASGAGFFSIDIKGVGGHGSRPDLSHNVVRTACDLYQQLIAIPVNRHNPLKACVVSPCVIQAGNRNNVIPEIALVEGNFRFFEDDDYEVLSNLIRSVSDRVANLYDTSAEVTIEPVAKYPVINDPAVTAIGAEAALACGYELLDLQANAGSDNFAEFLYAFPGFYCMIGSRSDRPGTTGMHHAPNFDIDESVLPLAVDFFIECTKRLLQ